MSEHGADTHSSADPGVLYLTRADLESLGLGMAQVVDAIDAAFRARGRGAAAMPPKASVHGEAGAFSQVMAAALPDGLGAKWVCLFPANLRPELPGLEFRGCDRPAQVCQGAGVVVSAITMSAETAPPLAAGLLEPGALAVALDYDAAWSSAAMAECDRFVVDDTAQALATKAVGVRLAGIPGRIHADLGELAAGVKVGRERPDERIFCMNLGVAIEDVAVGGLAYRRAVEEGKGRHLPL
jgi:ornithine cyclodeaminase/alanine dehydrogenase-like protein (mu-crystallin family)